MSPPRSINPTHLKTRFAYRFLRAIKNLSKTKRTIVTTKTSAYDHHNNNQINRRSHRVKIASYAAMASVVGSRRAWSRSILWKIRNRSRNHGKSLVIRKDKRRRAVHKTFHHHDHEIRRRNPNPERDDSEDDPFGYSGLEAKLRKLVPGAETMDACCLLEETADYIKCLATQVEVMKTILDLYSTT